MQTIQTTAKIYQFPVRDRSAIAQSRSNTASGALNQKMPAAPMACGDGWYHDAAIADSQKPAKR